MFAALGVLCPNALHAASLQDFVGEKITYDIKKLGLNVGKATIEMKGLVNPPFKKRTDKKYVLIIFTSEGLKFYDREKIYLDPATLLPWKVYRQVRIFGREERLEESYDLQKGLVRIEKEVYNPKNPEDPKRETMEIIKENVLDNIYGFIYRYRLQGLFVEGENVDITLPTKDVTMTLKGTREIKVEDTKKQAYYLESDPKQYRVWFDQTTKVPLKIDGAVGFGSTSMVMVEYEKQ